MMKGKNKFKGSDEEKGIGIQEQGKKQKGWIDGPLGVSDRAETMQYSEYSR